MSSTYDLIIIGSGPAGYVGALRAAQLGASVAVVERDLLGGVCLNRGCIPTKAVLESALRLRQAQRAREFGIDLSVGGMDFGRVIARAQGVVGRLRRGLEGLLRSAGVEVLRGRGRLLGSDGVQVETEEGTKELRGRGVLVAAGAGPAVPTALRLADPRVVTSDDLLGLEKLPRRLLVVGAGVVGCEYACIFSLLGVEVTVVEMTERILGSLDEDLAKGVSRALRRHRVRLLLGTQVTALHPRASGVVAELDRGDPVEVDLVLVAAGRRMNVEDLGLAEAGVEVSEGRIVVDERGRTSAAGVWAAGDVTGGRWLLAHWASRQAVVAVEDALGAEPSVPKGVVPFGIFTVPEVASVGMTEAEARGAGGEVLVGRFPFTASGRAVLAGETEGFVKVVAETSSRRLLGVHILGAHAVEMIHEAALAVEMGATVEDLIHTVHAHPTFSEALQEAALDTLGLALHLPARGRP